MEDIDVAGSSSSPRSPSNEMGLAFTEFWDSIMLEYGFPTWTISGKTAMDLSETDYSADIMTLNDMTTGKILPVCDALIAVGHCDVLPVSGTDRSGDDEGFGSPSLDDAFKQLEQSQSRVTEMAPGSEKATSPLNEGQGSLQVCGKDSCMLSKRGGANCEGRDGKAGYTVDVVPSISGDIVSSFPPTSQKRLRQPEDEENSRNPKCIRREEDLIVGEIFNGRREEDSIAAEVSNGSFDAIICEDGERIDSSPESMIMRITGADDESNEYADDVLDMEKELGWYD